MEALKLNRIEILPKDTENPLFEQREAGRMHTSYERETIFFTCIQTGNVDALESGIAQFMEDGVVVGRLSLNDLRQMQYWAVSCITLATRYAIQGGLEETEAYNLSDRYIRQLDQITKQDGIMPFLVDKAYELTRLVQKAGRNEIYPAHIRACCRYVSQNLHHKITVKELAEHCHMHPDYLSRLFKQEVGVSLSSYILKQKLEAAKAMLNGSSHYSDVSNYLSFCSESYFIACFKKEYGLTPGQYVQGRGVSIR